jgi:MFS family permease
MIENRNDLLEPTKNHSWQSALGIFIGAFLFAFQDNASLIAVPWQVISLGGKELAVGAVGMLSLGTYTVFCILTGSRFGRLGAKRLSVTAISATMIIQATMPLTTNIGILLALFAAKGMFMSMFWPPVMGWVSAGLHGDSLNRRLGIFNFSWSSGAIVGALLGGILFSIKPWLAFAVPSAACFIGAIALLWAWAPECSSTGEEPLTEDATGTQENRSNLVTFQWISRVGLVLGWIAYGALRVPIASLLNEMSLGANLHAVIAGGINLIWLLCFIILGRFSGWHFRFGLMAAAMLILIGSIAGVGISKNGTQLLIFILLSSPVTALIYNSHMYYSVSGSGHRQRSAAIHEILLAIGFSIGSFGGGALGHSIGMRNVYFVVAGVIALALLIQIGIYLRGRQTSKATCNNTGMKPAAEITQ